MKRHKILVVDDDKAILHILENRLIQAGYEVVVADCGEEALTAAQKQGPALVLLDIIMPGMDGYEVLEQLQDGKKTRKLPVIMLTSKSDTRSVARAINMGARDYIVKPFVPAILLEKIKRNIGKKK